MRRKRFFLTALCLLLMLCCTFTSCDLLEPENPGETETPGDTPAGDGFQLTANGKFAFNVILPKKPSVELEEAANDLINKLKTASGISSEPQVLWDNEESKAEFEICIGNTNRAESGAESAKLTNEFEYRIVISNNRMIIVGGTDYVLAEALTDLISDLTAVIKLSKANASIEKGYTKTGRISTNFPGINNTGTLKGQFNCGDGTYVLYTTDVTKKAYTDYLTFLEKNGCVKEETYTIGTEGTVNEYTFWRNSDYTVYCSYLPMKSAMRVYVGKSDEKIPTTTAEPVENPSTVRFWQIEVDTSVADGGMSYVFQLSDGTFMIIDGGYNTRKEADNLYNHLKANVPEGQTPVITAWFITHLHIDHYGALKAMENYHADDVEVKAFYYNFPFTASTNVDLGKVNAQSVEQTMKTWKNATRYNKIHSGMTFELPGITIQTLFSYEDLYPNMNLAMNTLPDDKAKGAGNETSLTFMVTVQGETEEKILFLGDAEDDASTVMESTIPEEAFKCKIFQLAHHGYEGCNTALYSKTGASVCLWTMNVVPADTHGENQIYRTVGKTVYESPIEFWKGALPANQYVWESKEIKEIILMGAGTREIELPYEVPTEWSRPNYNAIYEQRTGKKVK